MCTLHVSTVKTKNAMRRLNANAVFLLEELEETHTYAD